VVSILKCPMICEKAGAINRQIKIVESINFFMAIVFSQFLIMIADLRVCKK